MVEYPLAAVDTLPSPAENRMLGGVSGWVGLRARVWLRCAAGGGGGAEMLVCFVLWFVYVDRK